MYFHFQLDYNLHGRRKDVNSFDTELEINLKEHVVSPTLSLNVYLFVVWIVSSETDPNQTQVHAWAGAQYVCVYIYTCMYT